MSLTVTPYAGTDADWDGAVRGLPGWTHCHLAGWRRVMADAMGHETLYLVAHGPGTIRGVLPLVRVRSLVFGHYLVSLPFLNYGGPLGDPEAVQALARAAVDRRRTDGARLLELRSRGPLPLDLSVSHRKVTVVLDLPESDPEPLWASLKAKVRSQVRRPRKEGVSVAFGRDQLAPFYDVFARHMRDLGTPVLGRSFFETILDVFPDDTWIGCAWHQGRPVAAGLGFRWGAEFEMTWASSLRSHSRIAPNMLLYWTFMERCVAEGVRTFNFGRCTPGGGTHRFKRQWGGRDEPLHWYQDARGAAVGTPSPDGGAFAWGPRIWRRLPVGLTRLIGPPVVRLIP